MLENIKSSYFSSIIFSHLDEAIKLKIIKYNKNIQRILDINIINYKVFTGKYIIYESKEKGKEYNSYNDELLYEGAYLNGERNGKGKEYNYHSDIKFEGEYLNGERNGKGKEYYKNGFIKFEGEYLNGFQWNGNGYNREKDNIYELKEGKGIIKEYDYFGELKFKGEYLNGKRNGKGKEYISDYLWFEGEFFNGLKWNGKLFNNKNIIYELKNGKGFV